MPIRFASDVPRWMRGMVTRWARVLGFNDWQIEISRATDEEMREGAGFHADEGRDPMGLASVAPEYLAATIEFNEELSRENAEDFVIHELLHAHYSPFDLLFRQLWDRRRKTSREQAERMLSDLIEASIQRHVRQMHRARGKK